MYHIDCLVPALPCVPEGDWVCPECIRREEIFNGIGEEEESREDAAEELDLEYEIDMEQRSSESEREYNPE